MDLSLGFTYNVISNLHSKSKAISEENNIKYKDTNLLSILSVSFSKHFSLVALLCPELCFLLSRHSQIFQQPSGIPVSVRLTLSHIRTWTWHPETTNHLTHTLASCLLIEMSLWFFLFFTPESLSSHWISCFTSYILSN